MHHFIGLINFLPDFFGVQFLQVGVRIPVIAQVMAQIMDFFASSPFSAAQRPTKKKLAVTPLLARDAQDFFQYSLPQETLNTKAT